MGLVDGIKSKIGGQAAQAAQGALQGQDMASVAKLVSSNGGLQGMVSKLSANGLGDQVQSWVGTGSNEAVTGTQVKEALDPESLQNLAQQTGSTPEEASEKLAKALPQVVDKATPQGEMPAGDPLAGGADALKKMFGKS